MITLYEHTESPCCQKIRLVLAEKNLPYESVFIDIMAGANSQPDFLALNPKAQVPVLVHKFDGEKRVVTESTVIAEYLEDSFPETPLFPAKPYDKALARKWSMKLDTGIHVPHTASLTFTIVFRDELLAAFDSSEKRTAHLSSIQNPANREARKQMLELGYDAPYFHAALKAFDELFKEMQVQLEKTKWLAGDEFTYADIAVSPYVKRCLMLDLDEMIKSYPRILGWYDTLILRDSWTTEISAKDAMFVAFFKQQSAGVWDEKVKPLLASDKG